ncbi:MAG: hypothetical protein KBA61_07805 [Spirochaetes bacterium]|nr:hypothetical protein [Spirochaetota bacterium]
MLFHTTIPSIPWLIYLLLAYALLPGISCINEQFDSIIRSENEFNSPKTLPVPGSSGIISTSSITDESVFLSWTRATASMVNPLDLEYRAYRCDANSISTPADAEAHGIPLCAWTKDMDSLNATGLDPGKTCYFNVIVRTPDGRMSAYVPVMATTIGTIYLYSSGTSPGDLAVTDARTDADALCAADPPPGPTHWRAFISISAGDAISGFPANYSVPTDRPIRSESRVMMAGNWADLMNGSINQKLNDAGVSTASWWSGSSDSGDFYFSANCDGWTDGGGTSNGRTGSPEYLDFNWISNLNTDCSTGQAILCIAW